MARAFTVETTIAHPTDDVWAALTDWDRAHLWMGVDWVRADGDTEEGMTLTFQTRNREHTSTITHLTSGRSITLRSTQGGATADYTYRLEPIDPATTLVTLDADCTLSGLWRAGGPLLRVAMKRTDGGQLEALADVVAAE
ncbi:MAG: SRPBCC family protein [Acidimicrobiales bacterium]